MSPGTSFCLKTQCSTLETWPQVSWVLFTVVTSTSTQTLTRCRSLVFLQLCHLPVMTSWVRHTSWSHYLVLLYNRKNSLRHLKGTFQLKTLQLFVIFFFWVAKFPIYIYIYVLSNRKPLLKHSSPYTFFHIIFLFLNNIPPNFHRTCQTYNRAVCRRVRTTKRCCNKGAIKSWVNLHGPPHPVIQTEPSLSKPEGLILMLSGH